MRRKGFTLLELVVVVIILGILASLGVAKYVQFVERSRTAEAKSNLGLVRAAQEAYQTENNTYLAVTADTNWTTLGLSALSIACNATHYFKYTSTGTASAFTATATRCIATDSPAGKPPAHSTAYTVTIDQSGNLVCTSCP